LWYEDQALLKDEETWFLRGGVIASEEKKNNPWIKDQLLFYSFYFGQTRLDDDDAV
jgi:hypothetical protein